MIQTKTREQCGEEMSKFLHIAREGGICSVEQYIQEASENDVIAKFCQDIMQHMCDGVPDDVLKIMSDGYKLKLINEFSDKLNIVQRGIEMTWEGSSPRVFRDWLFENYGILKDEDTKEKPLENNVMK